MPYNTLKEKVINRIPASRSDALLIADTQQSALIELFAAANSVRDFFRGGIIDLCAIINAKSGACPEDCSYCAQSSKTRADIPVYPLVNRNVVLEKAREARDKGVRRFCIVTSGRRVGQKELKEIASMIKGLRNTGLLPCATLGLLNRDELTFLKDSGLERYHHNLETSERFFPEICRTHTYYDKLKTIEAARLSGLSICSGGIFGIGETWEDRIEMAFALREIDVDSIPINFLIPVKGTALGEREFLHPFEALKIISLYRFILPAKEIRICGGRVQALGEFHSMIFIAGADSILTGNYLTTTGRTYDMDIGLIRQHGLKI